MVDEASKTNAIRGADFAEKFLHGKVIDIGCGADKVCPWAEPFDQEHGDANVITRYRQKNTYDAVHSSHCLEHMFDPVKALHEWWQLVKPGGHIITIVPHEDLYEQGIWPSLFNGDHKTTFRLSDKSSWSKVSYHAEAIHKELPGAEIISAEIHDHGYDYALLHKPGQAFREGRALYNKFVHKIGHRHRFCQRLAQEIGFKYFKIPADQTLRKKVLAQIQVIARKNP